MLSATFSIFGLFAVEAVDSCYKVQATGRWSWVLDFFFSSFLSEIGSMLNARERELPISLGSIGAKRMNECGSDQTRVSTMMVVC